MGTSIYVIGYSSKSFYIYTGDYKYTQIPGRDKKGNLMFQNSISLYLARDTGGNKRNFLKGNRVPTEKRVRAVIKKS